MSRKPSSQQNSLDAITPGDFCIELFPSIRHKAALAELVKAFRYAQECKIDPWQFAIELERLERLGLSASDLRFMANQGYLAHASEVTARRDTRRKFTLATNLALSPTTCFVLTSQGVAFASQCLSDPLAKESVRAVCEVVRRSKANGLPSWGLRGAQWDSESRQLRVGGMVIKHFKRPAENQILVLSAFEEERWPGRIDDPLPPNSDIDPKDRLHDTIKSLNQNQMPRLLRFHGDGTGTGVIWERVAESDVK